MTIKYAANFKEEHNKMAPVRTLARNLPLITFLTGPLAVVIIISVLIVTTTTVSANDSVVRFGAGGIELVKTEHIRMLEEILGISPKKVRVKYRFLNESDNDIRTTVAFPFPVYGLLLLFQGYGVPSMFPTLKVLVNGRRQTTKLERKAVVGDKDITDQLRESGLTDKEIFGDDITSENEKALFAKLDQFKSKFGDFWHVSETAYWDMTFPAKKETLVEHEYKPAAGGGWSQWIDRSGEKSAERFKDMEELWMLTGKNDQNEDCLDEKTKRTIENKIKNAVIKGAKTVGLKYDSVEYILGTGRNWKGPIAEFKLRIIKEKPEQFVSLCFPGEAQKISPTVYEFNRKDFVPQDKLVVYFYTVDKR
jgi:hypothetical protein